MGVEKASVSSSAASSWSEAGAADEAGTGVRAASACGENICFTRSMKDAGCDAPEALAAAVDPGAGAGACATARTISAKRRTRA